MNGEFQMIGFIAMRDRGDIFTSQNEAEWFPLASAAKLCIGAAIASMVDDGRWQWDECIESVVFDAKEDSHILFPHLQGVSRLTLSQVTQVMIACHDHACATTLANRFGGWEELQRQVERLQAGLRVSSTPSDDVQNIGQLQAVADLLRTIWLGYKRKPHVWMPVIEGMVRQADKTPGIPPHAQWNMTGGLPQAFIDAGVVRNASGSDTLYVIAGKDLPNRQSNSTADAFAADWIRGLYNGSHIH